MTISQALLTLLVAAIPSSVVAILVWSLNRKGANKKLNLEAETVDATNAGTFSKIYQDLLDRANAAVAQAEKVASETTAEKQALEDRVKALEEAKAGQEGELTKTNTKLDQVRKLFQKYIGRVGIPMTADEQRIFDETVPASSIPRKGIPA